MKKKILVTGTSGMLGGVLAEEWHNIYKIESLAGKDQFDFAQESYFELKQRFDPEVIVHCGAIAQMDKCEQNPNLANLINGESVRKFIEAFPKAKMIFISSDAVYPLNTKMASEDITPRPATIYGKAKVIGENYIKMTNNGVAIRTTIVGRNMKKTGNSLAEWIVHSLLTNQEITLFDNVWFTPISIWHLADALSWVIENETPKLLNVSGSERVTKYQFGYQLAKELNLPTELIKKGGLNNVDTNPKRSNEMSLDSTLYTKLAEKKLPDLSEVVRMITKYYRKGAL